MLFELFENYPWPRILSHGHVCRKILFYLALTFVPVIILSLIDQSTKELFEDVAFFVRFLITLLLRLCVSRVMRNILGPIVDHFTHARLVQGAEIEIFNRIIERTRSRKDSLISKIVIMIFVLAITINN